MRPYVLARACSADVDNPADVADVANAKRVRHSHEKIVLHIDQIIKIESNRLSAYLNINDIRRIIISRRAEVRTNDWTLTKMMLEDRKARECYNYIFDLCKRVVTIDTEKLKKTFTVVGFNLFVKELEDFVEDIEIASEEALSI